MVERALTIERSIFKSASDFRPCLRRFVESIPNGAAARYECGRLEFCRRQRWWNEHLQSKDRFSSPLRILGPACVGLSSLYPMGPPPGTSADGSSSAVGSDGGTSSHTVGT